VAARLFSRKTRLEVPRVNASGIGLAGTAGSTKFIDFVLKFGCFTGSLINDILFLSPASNSAFVPT
jgi:hypothetical protein